MCVEDFGGEPVSFKLGVIYCKCGEQHKLIDGLGHDAVYWCGSDLKTLEVDDCVSHVPEDE